MTKSVWLIIALATMSEACGSTSPTVPTPNERATQVSLRYREGSPKTQSVLVGVPIQLIFEARDANNNVIADAQPFFKSSDTTAVVVTSTGVATAIRAPYGAIISATIASSSRTLADSVQVLTHIPLGNP